jgi:hypothetical protein
VWAVTDASPPPAHTADTSIVRTTANPSTTDASDGGLPQSRLQLTAAAVVCRGALGCYNSKRYTGVSRNASLFEDSRCAIYRAIFECINRFFKYDNSGYFIEVIFGVCQQKKKKNHPENEL